MEKESMSNSAFLVRKQFLLRSSPGSSGFQADKAILEEFDRAGLGEHTTILAMLESITKDESLPKIRADKAKAFKLLEQVTQEANEEMAKQVGTMVSRLRDAKLFFQELQDSVETLTGIAEEHGPRTLSDLMYLQNAILNGGFIDHYPGESNVQEIATGLPSGEHWVKFITLVKA